MTITPTVTSWNFGYGYGTGDLGLFEVKTEFVKNRCQALKLARKEFKYRMRDRNVKIYEIQARLTFVNKKFNFKHYSIKLYYTAK